MSSTISLKELLNLAIGSPELGAVNFNALHALLLGLLEHLQVGDLRRALSAEERDFIQPSPVSPEERGFIQPSPVSPEERGSPSSLFHQLQRKVATMESRLLQLDSLPSPSSLLQGSLCEKKPVEEMWQLMQLRRKVESNEEGVTKAMGAFQDLLSTFNSLRDSSSSAQQRLDHLSDQLTRMDIPGVERRLRDLEGRTGHLPLLTDRIDSLQKKLSSYPEPPDLVTWPLLHEALSGKQSSAGSLSADAERQNARRILGELATLPGKQQGLESRLQGVEEELKRLDLEMNTRRVPEDLLQQLRALRADLDKLCKENKKDRLDLKTLQSRLQDLTVALQQLESRTDTLTADLSETATFQSQLHDLERKKLNRDDFMRELEQKADRRLLEGKVGHAELEAAILDVNSAQEDLIKKLSLQESEWRQILEKLLAGLEAKLSRSDLDSIHRELEELWHFVKKHLNSGNTFNPDGAAGSRKKLFERVKCISCDRPVTMATGPHLVTVRSANLLPRNRPQSADLSKSMGDPQQVTDPEFQYSESPRPHTSCSLHRKAPRPQNLTTVYPYGEPAQVQYKNSKFDLMGVDGMMYRGSMEFTPEREAAGKTPQPPFRVRSAAPDLRSHSASPARTRSSRNTLHAPPTPDYSPPTFHVPTATETLHPFQTGADP